MNWATFSGTCSSDGIVWSRRGLSTATLSVMSSVIPLGSSGNSVMEKCPFPGVANSVWRTL